MKNNDNFYITEAFSRLKCLDEEVFDLSVDAGKLDTLKEFVADDIQAPVDEYIVDTEAMNELDLQDNYVGKVILECTCCHARIYKNEDEVVIDPDTGLANTNQECPVCAGEFGYNVIGKIEPFDDEKDLEEKPEEEPVDVEVEDEIEDEEIEEALKEALGEEEKVEDENQDLDEACEKNEGAEKIKKCYRCGREESEDDGVIIGSDGLCDVCHDDLYEGCEKEDCEDCDEACKEELEEADEKFPNPDKHEEVGEHNGVKMYHCNDCGKFAAMIDGKKVKKDSKEELEVAIDAKDESLQNLELASEDSKKLDEEKDDVCPECCKEPCEYEKGEDCDEACKNESLTEAIEEVEVKTEDGEVEVEKEGNKVTVEFKEEQEEEVKGDEGIEEIVPLTDEEISNIENNNNEEELIDEPNEEEIIDDEEAIDDFDEEGFEEMGESYLKRVYENVSSFKVNEVKESENKGIVVEGLITFESGKEAKTTFIFENSKTTKRGKTLFEGRNSMFSKSNKSFLLKGLLENKKFVCESLTYNYNASSINESNESETVKVYGRISR